MGTLRARFPAPCSLLAIPVCLRYACGMVNLLLTDDPQVAAKEVDAVAGDLIAELDRVIPSALHGREGAARAYVRAWRELSTRCLRLANDAFPDLVLRSDSGEFLLVDAKRARSPVGASLLDHLAIDAPFSLWVSRFGPGRGVALFLVARIRQALPGAPPLPVSGGDGLPHWEIDREEFSRFARHVWLELQHDQPLLERVREVFDLSLTELGRMFGVRRQAVSQWLQDGMPAARQPKALAIAQIADLLERNLLPARIPAVARTPAQAYGGRSMLDMIAEDRHQELLESVRRSFDWAVTA